MFAWRQKLGEHWQSLRLARSLLARRTGELFHVESTLARCDERRNRSYLWNWGDASCVPIRIGNATTSVAEDREVKLAEMIRIDDYFGFHNFFTLEFETQYP